MSDAALDVRVLCPPPCRRKSWDLAGLVLRLGPFCTSFMRQALCVAAVLIACPSSALHHATVLRRPCARPLPVQAATRRTAVPSCRAPDVEREAPSGVAVGGALASSAIVAEGIQIAGTAALLYLGQRYTGAESPVEVVHLESNLPLACSAGAAACPDTPPARSWCRC